MLSVRRAFSDGIQRVVSAPLLLVAIAAVSFAYPFHPFAAPVRGLAEYAVVVSFLLGGVIDRYARARPTRAYGFFGACGRHFGAMLRLAAIEIALFVAFYKLLGRTAFTAGAVTVVDLFMIYARIRLVVEDRRSAIGAMLAGGRFVTRHRGSVVVYSVWMVVIAAAAWFVRAAGPILVLPLLATAAAFFQARLAHAAYTAAPPLQWPESPAAEAIANHR
jgi:hypothetical protein